MEWKYFKIEEFDDPNIPDSAAENMDYDFISLLNKIRHESGVPMRVTSGWRSKETNDALEHSVPNSSHLKGIAVDIACDNGIDRQKIIAAAIKNKCYRIGVGKTFLHLDCDPDKNASIWLYS